MNTKELLQHVIKEVPNFKNPEILGKGLAYHYSANWNAINSSGKLYGAPIDENLDKTQLSLKSPPATSDPGVVFAYERLEDAMEEGFGCDIIEIEYNSAIRAMHGQESALDDLFDSAISELGDDIPNEETPHTLLILNTEITGFQLKE